MRPAFQLKDKETRHDGAVTSASIVVLDGFRRVAPMAISREFGQRLTATVPRILANDIE
jgi:hypothetical protein